MDTQQTDSTKAAGGGTSSHLSRAREIYVTSYCNHGAMAHGDDYREYKNYAISRIQEEKWRHEYIEQAIAEMAQSEASYLTAASKLSIAFAFEALPKLIAASGRGDSYTRLFYAIYIWDLAQGARSSDLPAATRKLGKEAAISTWKALIVQPVQISDENRSKISNAALKALGASNAEEYITNYANKKLQETAPLVTFYPTLLLSLVGLLLLWWLMW